ncbi:LytR/AlgR family response regulator transcription factor [Enterococcus camelliae]|uniref:LytR/AlgR family response regulator transcription factor n=1 Tax=Enterococcus camelliae TaxID=453959 RepID=A0ABW5TGT0_9ENTE
MSIFILEDQYLQRRFLFQTITELLRKNQVEIDNIFSFGTGEELLSKSQKFSGINLFLLDIEIRGDKIAGLEIAKTIREKDSESIIVFVTSHSELALLSYEYMVSALTFLDKSVPVEALTSKLDDIISTYLQLQQKHITEEMYFFKNQNVEIKIPLNSILYFSTLYDHKIEMIVFNQLKEFYCSLVEIEVSHEKFVRIHQSYLINTDNVECIKKREKLAVMKNGDSLPISRRFYKKVLLAFEEEH